MYMHHLMTVAGKENVFYMDTDSLFVNEAGSSNLKDYIAKNEIGKLKFEKEGNDLFIRGAKDYYFAEKETIKGIRKNAVKLAFDTYLQDLFPGFASDLARMFEGHYTIRKVTKVLKRNYDKGYVTATGEVKPLRMGD